MTTTTTTTTSIALAADAATMADVVQAAQGSAWQRCIRLLGARDDSASRTAHWLSGFPDEAVLPMLASGVVTDSDIETTASLIGYARIDLGLHPDDWSGFATFDEISGLPEISARLRDGQIRKDLPPAVAYANHAGPLMQLAWHAGHEADGEYLFCSVTDRADPDSSDYPICVLQIPDAWENGVRSALLYLPLSMRISFTCSHSFRSQVLREVDDMLGERGYPLYYRRDD